MSSPTTDHSTGDFPPMSQHEGEPHADSLNNLLNRLRASVLGANDGIVSVAGIVMGFAGATSDRHLIFLGGMAGLVAGALSMAAGEYASVSTQRDTERALIAKETRELADLYRERGLSEDLAREVALELTAHDALRSHLDIELGIDPDELTSPWQAAASSMLSFTLGAVLPLLTILLFADDLRIYVTVGAVTLALVLTGYISARIGGAPGLPAVVRNVTCGLLAMAITYAVGSLIGIGVH
jgi:VIT1/CCC1 family predicted Fe2+/Mn2+ transporter